MNVLSLFDGMSCAQQALERSEFQVNKYYASEIDKYAIQVTMANYPNTIQLGSVVNVDVTKLDKIDFLLGGSPCQSFSFAGKRKGMSTKCETEILTLEHYLELKQQGFEFEGQSYLFWEYMRILTDIRKINPNVKFLLENVEMGEKWEKVLSKAIGVNGIHINSALVSAQNRKRIYWTNIGMQPGGLFGDMVSTIQQPKDKGILLKDILENEVDEKYFLSEKALKYIQKAKFRQDANVLLPSEKSVCLQQARKEIVKIDKKGNVKENQDKASCFTAGGNSGGNHSDMDLICVAMRGRNIDNPSDRRKGIELVQQLEPRTDNKTNCLTLVQKDNLVIQLNPSKESGGKQPYQQNRVYDINGINPSLTTLWNGSNLINTSRIRRLTPTECERLQTVKDGYTSMVSDTQRYKMLGNGWTIDVICHILSYLKD
jgi:DNA (cytosine-5)-methyltransferase 3A